MFGFVSNPPNCPSHASETWVPTLIGHFFWESIDNILQISEIVQKLNYKSVAYF